jgi:hypothetical protein
MLVAQLAAVGHAELVMQTLLDGQTEHVVHPAPVGQFIPDGQLAPVMQLVHRACAGQHAGSGHYLAAA